MAIPKILGLETEYGISVKGTADPNPVIGSSLLINAYVDSLRERTKVGWDFEDESPGTDARGFSLDGAQPPMVETHLVNTVLTNGARYYVDHAHPEYSTPECVNAREVVVVDKAGERILARSMAAVRTSGMLDPGQEIIVYKNNSDGKGNSYGTHENYLIDRQTPFGSLVRNLIPWFVTRQVFAGAGKVGGENGSGHRGFQITQRADFFEEEVGLETTLKRPIINTRDEPHADPQRYRRLHVIVGDANLCEVATFLKVGSTAIVLSMIEDGAFERDFTLASPVKAIREISHDPSLRATVQLAGDGTRMTAVELQWEFFDRAKKYTEEHGFEASGGEAVGREVMAWWERVLTDLELAATTGDFEPLNGKLDWVTKQRILEGFVERDGLAWNDPKLALIDLQYHDMRPEKSLYEKLVRNGTVERIVSEEEIAAAITAPPETTRAYFRGTCLTRWPESVVAANWDSIILDVGSDPLRRIPMLEPNRGTKAMTEALFSRCQSPGDLVEALGA